MFQNAENEEEEKAESLRTSASIKSCDIEFHLKRVELRKKKYNRSCQIQSVRRSWTATSQMTMQYSNSVHKDEASFAYTKRKTEKLSRK